MEPNKFVTIVPVTVIFTSLSSEVHSFAILFETLIKTIYSYLCLFKNAVVRYIS